MKNEPQDRAGGPKNLVFTGFSQDEDGSEELEAKDKGKKVNSIEEILNRLFTWVKEAGEGRILKAEEDDVQQERGKRETGGRRLMGHESD